MRHLHRWLVNGLVAVSFLLSLATAILWARSYFTADTFESEHLPPATNGISRAILNHIASGWGQLSFERYDWRSTVSAATGFGTKGWEHTDVPKPSRGTFRQFAFAYSYFQHKMGSTTVTYLRIAVPYWFPALVFTPLPILRLVASRRRQRRSRLGLCDVCDFDLRASVGRCPECGTVMRSRVSA